MTRYQAAMSALFARLEKARAASEEGRTHDCGEHTSAWSPTPQVVDSSARRTQRLTWPPTWQRPAPSPDRPPLLIRLWRAVRRGDRPGTKPQE
jgi:hypothetical protein